MSEKMLGDIRDSVKSIGERVDDRLKGLDDRLTVIETDTNARSVSLPGVTADTNEKDHFSFCRYIWAKRTGDWSFAGYEKEVLDETRKKALAAGSGAGSDLVPTEVMSEIIPLLRSKMILEDMGVRRMSGLTGSPVQIPRQTAAATGYWVGENSAITASDSNDDLLSLTPKKAAAMSQLSNTMLRTGIASGTIEQYVRDDLANVLARTIQTAFFNGSGSSNQPTGVLNVSGINTVDWSSVTTKALVADALMDMIKELDVDNVDVGSGSVAWCMHPRVFHALAKYLRDADTEIPVLTGNQSTMSAQGSYLTPNILGFPFFTTTDMPTELSPTDSDILLAKWDEVIFADWASMELAVSTEADTAFANDQTWVRVIQEVDVLATHEVAICAGRDFVY